MTLAELNAMDRVTFVDAIGWVFEHSPWVAERAWLRRPFAILDELHSAMSAEVTGGTRSEQLELLCAHPDLGARARMTAASLGEQAGAGLDALTSEEFGTLHRLNADYRRRYGFPFIYAVKGSTKHDILKALERRAAAGPDEEFAEALSQVLRIAAFRLEELIER